MKHQKKPKFIFKRSTKIWGLGIIALLLVSVILLVSFKETITLNSQAASNTIQFIDHVTAQSDGEQMSISIGRPNNVRQGDILVAMIGSDYAHVDKTPSGWKVIQQDVKNSGHKDDLALQSYYKIVGSAEDSEYTWKFVTKRKDTPSEHQPLIAVELYAFRGVNQNKPIFSKGSHSETENPEEIKCPSVKGVKGGVLLCSYMGDDPGSIEAPASMTQTSNFEIGGGDSFATAYEKLNSNSKTGSRVAYWANPENKNGSDFAHAIVLRP